MKFLHATLIVILMTAAPALVEADVVIDWNETALQAIRDTATAPPVASRALAITHAAIFDSVNSIYSTYTPYYEKLPGYSTASPEAAAAWAGYTALTSLFGFNQKFVDQRNASLAAASGTPQQKLDGETLGITIATNLLNWRAGDGWNAVYNYTNQPIGTPGAWQKTPPGDPNAAPFLLPQWGGVEPFAMTSNTQFVRKQDPPDVTSNLYAKAYNEVKSIGAKDSSTRTPEQTQIALFWADGAGTETPPGHWNSIAQTVAQSEQTDLVENARLFALLNLAEGDAAIAAWYMKLSYDYWRPLTAIREGDLDGNPKTVGDPEWEPLVGTPPFPSYVSGHSTFSGAAAAILGEFFKDKTSFTSTSDGLDGVERTFERFSEAAAEAGLSRIYGGIHWDFDNEIGLRAGEELGEYIFANFLTPLKTEALLAGLSTNGIPAAPLPGTLVMSLSGLFGIFLAGRRRMR